MIQRKKSLRDYCRAKSLRLAQEASQPQSAVMGHPRPQKGQQVGLRRKKGIAKQSEKRAKELRQYAIRRKMFLEAHPFCAVAVAAAQKSFINRLPGTFALHTVPATEIHHIYGRRGKWLLDERYWLPVSRTGHEALHANPNAARQLGFIAPRGA